MAAAAVVPFVTVDEYLRMSFEHDADYIDGRIEERPVGELDHADLQGILLQLLGSRRHEWGVKALPELRVQVAKTRFRIPDLTVLSVHAPREQIVRTPPLLCIEILSPEDRWPRMEVRLRDYFTMGVPVVWVFNPEDRTATVVEAGGARTLHHEGILTLPGTPVELPLAEVFAVLDE